MSDPITRLNAALEGRYRIERELGEGGMATVYLADDLRHERKVALKVLKPELAAVVGADRFLAEIKTTANLQHPHILPLHDSGETDGFLYYVMPYVEGESLRERLDRDHQLPVDEAVRIATNVAEALAYAHTRRVIHRDIKPANILLQSGKPVISDFGIALAVGVAGGGRLTETGLSLGTPHYMSPEQATGDLHVGPATDIYAVGCVLYEMLVGEPPFTGSTPQAVLGRILTGEVPSAKAERSSVPANVEASISKALQKIPADRFGSAGDLAVALGDPGYAPVGTGESRPAKGRALWNPVSVSAAAVAAASIALLAWSSTRPGGPDGILRLSIPVPGGFEILDGLWASLAVSPDGSMVAFSDNGDLYLRRLDSDSARLIDRSTMGPTFSPDGRALAYLRSGSGVAYRVPVDGGVPTQIGGFSAGWNGMDWGDDGWIYGATGPSIWRIPADGGDRERVTVVDGINVLEAPQRIRGSELLLFSAAGPTGKPLDTEIMLYDLESQQRRVLIEGGAQGRYVPSGHLLYLTSDGTLMARRFDPAAGAVSGPAMAVASGVLMGIWAGGAAFSASEDGRVLALVRGDIWTQSRLRWFTRDGRSEPFGPPMTGWAFAIHPNGVTVAVSVAGATNDDIYLWEEGSGAVRLSADPVSEGYPVWSPDGTELVWQADGGGERGWRLMRYHMDDGSLETVFERANSMFQPRAWSADGAFVSVTGLIPGAVGGGFRFIDVRDSSGVRVVGETLGASQDFSPDGRWLAYCAAGIQAGEGSQIMIVSADGSGAPQPVASGCLPRWSGSGQELFYVLDDARIVAAAVQSSPTFRMLRADTLFAVPNLYSTVDVFDVTPDGQRFLLKVQDPDAVPTSIDLVLGFDQELRRLVPN